MGLINDESCSVDLAPSWRIKSTAMFPTLSEAMPAVGVNCLRELNHILEVIRSVWWRVALEHDPGLSISTLLMYVVLLRTAGP